MRNLQNIVAMLRDPPWMRQARVDNLDRIYARPIQSGAIYAVERRLRGEEDRQRDLFVNPQS